MIDSQLGWARNWVQTSTTVGNFSAAQFDADLREGKLVAGNGIVVLVELAGHGPGFTPVHPGAGDKLKITVKAPPWIPVEEVRLVTSKGTQIVAQDLPQPDPFGTETTRFTGEVSLSLSNDDFVIVEAGMRYPLAADLDDDGVPDTTDNNRDGVVDTDDVDPDEDVGPLVAPPDPTDPADPHAHRLRSRRHRRGRKPRQRGDRGATRAALYAELRDAADERRTGRPLQRRSRTSVHAARPADRARDVRVVGSGRYPPARISCGCRSRLATAARVAVQVGADLMAGWAHGFDDVLVRAGVHWAMAGLWRLRSGVGLPIGGSERTNAIVDVAVIHDL